MEIFFLRQFFYFCSLGEGVFRDLFWRLKKEMPEKIAAVCPDVMFNTNPSDLEDINYVSFANKHLIHRIVEPSGRVRWYGCRHGLSYTTPSLCKRVKGLGLSPAEMENLADVIKFFLKACEDAGAFCELYAGTIMGLYCFMPVPFCLETFRFHQLITIFHFQNHYTEEGNHLTWGTMFRTPGKTIS